MNRLNRSAACYLPVLLAAVWYSGCGPPLGVPDHQMLSSKVPVQYHVDADSHKVLTTLRKSIATRAGSYVLANDATSGILSWAEPSDDIPSLRITTEGIAMYEKGKAKKNAAPVPVIMTVWVQPSQEGAILRVRRLFCYRNHVWSHMPQVWTHECDLINVLRTEAGMKVKEIP